MKITKEQVTKILREELLRIKEASITKDFQKAIEAYQEVQLKQQKFQQLVYLTKRKSRKNGFLTLTPTEICVIICVSIRKNLRQMVDSTGD